MLYPVSASLAEIPTPINEPAIKRQAALLIFSEISRDKEPSDEKMGQQLACMEGASRIVLVALEDETVVATGALDIPDFGERIASLEDVAVAPNYQGESLGSRVIRFLEMKAREANTAAIATAPVPGAEGFYERLGYQRSTPAAVFTKLL